MHIVCRKLVDTPFPFPWSQTIIVFLLIYSLTIPIMMAAYIQQAWLGVVLTFISGARLSRSAEANEPAHVEASNLTWKTVARGGQCRCFCCRCVVARRG